MDALPNELVLQIFSFLDAKDIAHLNLVSQRTLKITRDNELWKRLCFNDSLFNAARVRRDCRSGALIPIQEPTVFELQRAIRSTHPTNKPRSSASRPTIATKHSKALASWDPIYPGEDVNWYSEYIARHSPLSLSWLEEPGEIAPHLKEKLEMRGLGLLKDAGENKIIAPLDDGSVCLWSLGEEGGDSGPRRGRILTRSRPGLLSFDNGQKGSPMWQSSATSRIRMPGNGMVECVSIDSSRNKAYVAVQQGLSEIDLNTLQRCAYDQYQQPISVVSEASHPTPLTIGTTQALFIHDPRLGNNGRTSPYTSLSHCVDEDDLCSLDSRESMHSSHAVLSQPLPLSIIHLPNTIYVAGRFPSILSYDRRFFPQISSSIHSGARLSALTCLPTPYTPTLVAAGEYNGKGSLEQYPLSLPGLPVQEPTRNRVSASRSKLLSVAPHGIRLLFSDSDGQLTWMERDGTTLVRRWNINTHSTLKTDDADTPRGIFNASVNDGDVTRKLLPVGKGEQSEVCVWTGEKIGVLGFRKNARFSTVKVENPEDDAESSEMGNMMRRALERQANEVRYVRGLGLGSSM